MKFWHWLTGKRIRDERRAAEQRAAVVERDVIAPLRALRAKLER
jgi:hypothetical protein